MAEYSDGVVDVDRTDFTGSWRQSEVSRANADGGDLCGLCGSSQGQKEF